MLLSSATCITLLAGASTGLARSLDLAPRANIVERATSYCDVFDQVSVESGLYTAYNNLWGTGKTGSQCITVNSAVNGVVNWDTTYFSATWNWSGNPNGVKSYSNIQLNHGINQAISKIKTIQSSWSWDAVNIATGSTFDVSYDLFLAPTTTAKHSYEIMIWLSNHGGAGPASSTGKAIASMTIAGYKWTLWQGVVNGWTVYSFVTAQGDIKAFKGDIKLFLNYLTQNKGVSSSLLLTTLQQGTEPFHGAATLRTSAYKTVIA